MNGQEDEGKKSSEQDKLGEGKRPTTIRAALSELLDPVPLSAIVMIGGVMFLLLSAILNFDQGHVLINMGRPEYARGLITYLFTIVTIGTAIVLIISALLGRNKEYFERGKEILGLMLGVFGTIVGFYFGSEVSQMSARGKLALNPPLLSASQAVSGSHLTVTTLVQGGIPPYHFAIVVGEDLPKKYDQTPRSDGWIVGEITVPDTDMEREEEVSVGVSEANGDIAITKATFIAKPKLKPQ